MTEQREVKVSQVVEAAPEAVFRALVNPLELQFWFCHHAWTDPKFGGDFQVRWNNGWWARGVYQMVERSRRVELSWQGKDEPGETQLAFQIEPRETGSLITVIHSGYGENPVWDKAVAEAEGSWPLALENLASVLATGIDLRVSNRPLLGIVPDELTPARATEEGIPIESGIYLASVTADGPAADAGLKKADVITSIGGLAVSDRDSLATTLAAFRGGDRVPVHYVRGGRLGTTIVELKSREVPEISFDPSRVADKARAEFDQFVFELRQATAGLSDDEAAQKPSSFEWSIKEVLAHLVLSERFRQRQFADLVAGTTGGRSSANPTTLPEALAMVLGSTSTIAELLTRLEQHIDESLAFFEALRPEFVAMKARYRAMATSLLSDVHRRDHLKQIQAILAEQVGA